MYSFGVERSSILTVSMFVCRAFGTKVVLVYRIVFDSDCLFVHEETILIQLIYK